MLKTDKKTDNILKKNKKKNDQNKIYQKQYGNGNFFYFKSVVNKITNIVSKTLNLGAHEAIPYAPE